MIKRYTVYGDTPYPLNQYGDLIPIKTEVELTSNGEWCKWEDVEKLLEQKDDLIRKLYLNQRLDIQGLKI